MPEGAFLVCPVRCTGKLYAIEPLVDVGESLRRDLYIQNVY